MKKREIYQLLASPVKPLPADSTHFILYEILNKDLSIKRVTIYYNPSDSWGDEPTFLDKVKSVGVHIVDEMFDMRKDTNALAYRISIINKATQQIVIRSSIRYFTSVK